MKKEYDLWVNKRNTPHLELYTKLQYLVFFFIGINMGLTALYCEFLGEHRVPITFLILSCWGYEKTWYKSAFKQERDLTAVIIYEIFFNLLTVGSVYLFSFWMLIIVYMVEVLGMVVVILDYFRPYIRSLSSKSKQRLKKSNRFDFKKRGSVTYIQILVYCSCLILLGGTIGLHFYKTRKVEAFDVEEYKQYIVDFPSNEILGSVGDAGTARKKAEDVWIKIYGKDIKSERPYQIFYDDSSEVWLVRSFFHEGLPWDQYNNATHTRNVAYVIIKKSDGQVLAIWRDEN